MTSIAIEKFRSKLFVSEKVFSSFGGIFLFDFENACGGFSFDFFPLPKTNKHLVLVIWSTCDKEVIVGQEINRHNFL